MAVDSAPGDVTPLESRSHNRYNTKGNTTRNAAAHIPHNELAWLHCPPF